MTAIAVVTTVASKKEARYDAVERAIRDLHSYELPAIHAFPFAHVSQAYGDWIEASVA